MQPQPNVDVLLVARHTRNVLMKYSKSKRQIVEQKYNQGMCNQYMWYHLHDFNVQTEVRSWNFNSD